jgi:CMP-N,N'-diacetyllegionaminic acid synthase
MSVVCVIPARGGSKGLPRKNVMLVNNQPLISYTIKQALESIVDHVYVSTEDAEIASISKQYGASIIERPMDIAQDDTTTEAVLSHAIHTIEQNDTVDVFVFLSCTQPHRQISWINTCVERVKYDGYDSAFVGYKTHKNYWKDGKKLWWEQYSNRQTRVPVIQENTGTACASKPSIIRRGERIAGKMYIHEVDEYNLDIHDELDIRIAELILK